MVENIQTGRLNCGIRVIHQQNTFVRTAHLGLFIGAGTIDEPKDKSGLAHYIEHCLFKGTVKRKAYHIINRLENIGGELNAYTSKEEICIHASFLDQFYERTIELIADIFYNSTFPEKEIEKEKEVICDEISAYLDNPSEQIFDDFESIIFKNNPLGNPILGTIDSVRKLKKADILQYIDAHWKADKIVISSYGNISLHKLMDLLNRYFQTLRTGGKQNKSTPYKLSHAENLVLKKSTHQVHHILGGIAPNAHDDNRTSMALLNNILGGPGLNSRLNMELRERNGIAYNVESSYTAYSDAGLYFIYFGTEKEQYEKAHGIVLKELKKLQTQLLGSLQLSNAKKQILGQLALSYDHGSNVMLSMGKSMLLYNKVDDFKEIESKIEKISASEITGMADAVFRTDKISTLTYLTGL